MKKFLILLSFVSISMVSFSQEISKKIDKAAKDPKRAENAAKADVYVAGKKDVGPHSSANQQMINQKKKKSKSCKRNSK